MFSVKRFYAVVNLFDCIYLVTFRYGLYIHCGDDSAEVPPVLIPNTEVKLSCAESTRRATDREDRLLPLSIKPLVFTEGFLLVLFSFYFQRGEIIILLFSDPSEAGQGVGSG